jgi:oxygen-dependent protoporphyrinogen oxidase
MFGGRAPEGEKTLEVLVGGSRHPEHLNLTDRELIEQSYNDVRQLIHLPSPPVFSNVLRTKRGIPQLELGYGKLLRYRDELKETYPSLFVCGFGWNGIGMNEMITQAKHVATALTTSAQRDDTPIVKGIYF